MKFHCTFYGKRLGALGVKDGYSTVVEAENEEQAHLKLYDNYEHISALVITPVQDTPKNTEGQDHDGI